MWSSLSSRAANSPLISLKLHSFARHCYSPHSPEWTQCTDERNGDDDHTRGDANRDNADHQSRDRNRCKGSAFADCTYQLLTSRLLETVGWLGAALVVGLNLDSRFCPHSRASRSRPYCSRHSSTNWPQSSLSSCAVTLKSYCLDCKYCSSLFWRLIAFASPIKSQSSHYVLPATHDCHSLEKPDKLFRKDPIEELCIQLQSASIEYTEQLSNIIGVSLVDSKPDEAMSCWKQCANSASALFNIAVAFERGKHSVSGETDLSSAYHYYTKSATLGHKLAMYNLSLFYLYGKGGVRVDETKAHTLLRRAAQLGVKRAKLYCEQVDQTVEETADNETVETAIDHAVNQNPAQNRPLAETNDNLSMKASASAPDLTVMAKHSPFKQFLCQTQNDCKHFNPNRLSINYNNNISTSLQLLI